jgi:hypothetical protein
MSSPGRGVVCLALLFSTGTVAAMGLRSLVALPVEQGGNVLRGVWTHSTDTDVDRLTLGLAHGISGDQTLLLGLPYRVSPAGSNRSGDFSALYRHTVWQQDRVAGTRRVALLGGMLIPTSGREDARLQAGAVATFYGGRSETDLDLIWQDGRGASPVRLRYDLAWQYRLFPARHAGWSEDASEWDVDLELGGRYAQGSGTKHQATVGLQWIHSSWVLEGGLVRDLNKQQQQQVLLSMRVHF